MDPLSAGQDNQEAEKNCKTSEGDGKHESATAAIDGSDTKHSLQNNDKSTKNNTNNNRPNKRRKQNNTGHHKNNNAKTPAGNTRNLNESTTVDDLSTMDASTYLAWVNHQAELLPDVFVAAANDNEIKDKATSEQKANNNGVESSINDEKSNRAKSTLQQEEEEPIHGGSMSTLQVLLSKRMDILPPPSPRHLPPCHVGNGKNNNFPSSLASPDNGKQSSTSHFISNNSSISHPWVSTTISNFSKLRSHLEQEHAKLRPTSRSPTSLVNRKIAVPRMKDRAAWHVFCLGREEAYGNIGGYYEDCEEEEEKNVNDGKNGKNLDNGGNIIAKVGESTQGPGSEAQTQQPKVLPKEGTNGTAQLSSPPTQQTNPKQLIYNPKNIPSSGYPPTTSLLLQFDQVLTRMLFHHHVHYLCEWKFPLTQSRTKWIYALLARMEKPWHREECCAVRKVLRECCDRRWELVIPADPSMPSSSSGSLDEKKPVVDSKPLGKKNMESGGESTGKNEEGGCSEAWEQLALLNTLIAITGIYYEQGALVAGDGMDSLFSVANNEA
mmetsp:Transcript_9719/g.21916  ORF Transcript_9719/g.21916 Transcript_9719/m.21916 type:complete len:551 (+) Transcript_9719:168-1820(+)